MTPWTAARQTSLSIINSRSLLKLMSIASVMPSNHLILCCPRLLLPSIFPSIKVFSNESVLHIKWPKYWSFNFSISPSNEYSGLISFRMDWLDLLAVQGTLKSLLQHHSSKTSILWHIPSNFLGRVFKHQDYKPFLSSSSLFLEDPPPNSFTPGCQKPRWRRGLGSHCVYTFSSSLASAAPEASPRLGMIALNPESLL